MPRTSENNRLRTILYSAAIAVIAGVSCFAAAKQHTSLFFGSGNYASAAFFVSLILLYTVPNAVTGSVCAAVICIPASVIYYKYLFLFFPAVVFLILLFSSETRDKRGSALFIPAAVVEAGLFCAALIAALLRWRTNADFSENEKRSIPCAVFLLCIAGIFIYRSFTADKKIKEKKPAGKKAAKNSGSDRLKTAYLLGAFSAVSAAVYMYALLPVYEAKASAGIWAVTVFLAELKTRGWLYPGIKTRKDDGK